MADDTNQDWLANQILNPNSRLVPKIYCAPKRVAQEFFDRLIHDVRAVMTKRSNIILR